MAEPALNDVLTAMMGAFQPLLPAQLAGLPKPSLSVARAETRPSGIGNVIGVSPHGSIAAAEQHAIRVKAVLRFTLWGFVAADVDQAITALAGSIFAQRATLAAQGFLKLSFEGSSQPEEARQPIAWHRAADYEVLYEYPYEDVGGAVGLILPVQAQEVATATHWSVTANYGRWDDQAASLMSIRGPASITGLAALTFFANPVQQPTGGVSVVRTFDAAPAPPAVATLAGFIAQTTGAAPATNLSVSLPSVSALLAQFAPDGTPIAMGDRDLNGITDEYMPTRLDFAAPLVLASIGDRLEFSYAQPKFDRIGVLYLRAVRLGS